MHMWHHVTNHLIVSNDKESNSENRIKLRVRDKSVSRLGCNGQLYAPRICKKDGTGTTRTPKPQENLQYR
jgi:hypothetical protein